MWQLIVCAYEWHAVFTFHDKYEAEKAFDLHQNVRVACCSLYGPEGYVNSWQGFSS